MIDIGDRLSFSFYLVHVLFLDVISNRMFQLFMTIFQGKYEVLIIFLDYIFSLIGIWVVAYLYEKYIIRSVMRITNTGINYLSKLINAH